MDEEMCFGGRTKKQIPSKSYKEKTQNIFQNDGWSFQVPEETGYLWASNENKS